MKQSSRRRTAVKIGVRLSSVVLVDEYWQTHPDLRNGDGPGVLDYADFDLKRRRLSDGRELRDALGHILATLGDRSAESMMTGVYPEAVGALRPDEPVEALREQWDQGILAHLQASADAERLRAASAAAQPADDDAELAADAADSAKASPASDEPVPVPA